MPPLLPIFLLLITAPLSALSHDRKAHPHHHRAPHLSASRSSSSSSSSSSSLSCPHASDPAQRGINIGGWLVLESWITPSLFSTYGVADGSGEWEFCAHLGSGQRCADALKNHWQTWFTLDDARTLASAGFTHLRIPVGYWILDVQPSSEPFPDPAAGSMPYLRQALGWIAKLGLKVVLDLHGAPGSQNGHDNSGRSSGGIQWPQPVNIARTVSVLTALANLANEINAQPETACVVEGIELLNEPWTECVGGPISFTDTLIPFYENAYSAIRNTSFDGDIWVNDGFCYDGSAWDGLLSPPAYENVFIDTHIYHAFGGPRQQAQPWGNVDYTCVHDRKEIAAAHQRDWTVVGEWSAAIGPGTPATRAGATWLQTFISAQWEAYCPACVGQASNPGKGGFFWNFKTETGYEEWNYLLGLQQGWALNFSAPRSSYDFSCAAAYDAPM